MKQQAKKSSRFKRWLRALLGVVILYYGFQAYWFFQSKEVSLEQNPSKDVAGDLGGVPVIIPRHMVELVEYNGDPSWGEMLKRHSPERTQKSKLRGFVIRFRYPDMATLSNDEMHRDKKSKTIYNTDWMLFGVMAGSEYPGEAWFEQAKNIVVTGTGQYFWNKFTKLPEQQFGMDVYVLNEKDPRTGRPTREGDLFDAKDVFLPKNKQGKIVAYIECYNEPHAAALCTHSFGLESEGVRAKVYISYRRAYLKDWQDIQAKVTAMLLGFRVDPFHESVKPKSAP